MNPVLPRYSVGRRELFPVRSVSGVHTLYLEWRLEEDGEAVIKVFCLR